MNKSGTQGDSWHSIKVQIETPKDKDVYLQFSTTQSLVHANQIALNNIEVLEEELCVDDSKSKSRAVIIN